MARELTRLEAGDYILGVPSLTIELPPHTDQTEFNLRRWAELLANPEVARIEGRVETDRHGRIIMSPPPTPDHGRLQSETAYLLRTLLPMGQTITECPISTADGVKAADVAWASAECWRERGKRTCFVRSPEICIEVLSPSNTEEEIREKADLYFDSGASEVWVCGEFGDVTFFGAGFAPLTTSRLCPAFPRHIGVP